MNSSQLVVAATNEEGDGEEKEEEEEGDLSYADVADEMLKVNLDAIKTCTVGEIECIIRFLHDNWCDASQSLTDIHERNMAFFGNHTTMSSRYATFSKTVIYLDAHLSNLKFDDDSTLKNLKGQLVQVASNISYGFDSMVQSYRQLLCNQPQTQAALPSLRMDAFFSPIVESDMKSHQVLLEFYLEMASRRGYRKLANGALFKPKFTENGEFTRSYEYAMEISEFIYESLYPYERYKAQFLALTDNRSVPANMDANLKACYRDKLPFLIKDRTKFATRDGLFDARENKFYPYGVDPGWDSSVVCANYIDVHFEDDVYQQALHESGGDPLAIPTPNIQKILDAQDLSPDVCRWIYASLGRMVFPIGLLDGWQFVPFFKGTAGSGKSTLLRLAAKFYNDVDVGNLMSEGQKNFSIEHLVDKYVFFSYDVDDKMNFSLTRWNQMVSGENVGVERKFKSVLPVTWTVGGAFAGNSFPPWVDQAGNVSRRMLVVMFVNVIRNVDTKLFDKCMAELGAFLKKCVGCYLYQLERHGGKGIWDKGVLPKYFHDTKHQMQAETNPLQAFLQSEGCRMGTHEHVGFTKFRTAYFAFCDQLRLTRKALTRDFYSNVFDPLDIKTIEVPDGADPEQYDGYDQKYLLGVSLRDK